MRLSSIVYIWLCFTILSCAVDDFDNESTTPVTFEPKVVHINDVLTRTLSMSTGDGVLLECITITFPFQLKNTQNKLFDIQNQSQFDQITSDSSNQIIDFVFPLQVITSFETSVTVNNLFELAELAFACFPDHNFDGSELFSAYLINTENSCLTLKYPITVQDLAGKTYTIADEKTLVNATASEDLYFVFPLNLLDLNSQMLTANDQNELVNHLLSCGGYVVTDTTSTFSMEYYSCLKYVFPLKIYTSIDPNPKEIANVSVLEEYVFQGKFLDFHYPFDFITPNNTQITVNNQNELNEANEVYCGQIFNGSFIIFIINTIFVNMADPCYDVIYPMTLYKSNIDSVTIFNASQIENILMDSLNYQYELKFPFNIYLNRPTQGEVSVNSMDELYTIFENCN